MAVDTSPGSALGSGSWLGADEYEPGSALHSRATDFVSNVNWDVLTDIASTHREGMPCRYEGNFSIGHSNMVRRIDFDDGVSWVARLRLPSDDMFAGRQLLENSKVMEIEITSMKFFSRNTSIPVPEVITFDMSRENNVGAPYILMGYIHGTIATELREAKSCAPQLFGTPDQDRKFREQMARIQATVASFRFPQIGGLYHDPVTDAFYIGPELHTGKGPWSSSTAYYDDLTAHLLKSTAAIDDIRQNQAFTLPSVLNHLMRLNDTETTGPFRLTNRDFGAHNILVDNDFNIVGVLDFDGVMAAPLEVAAQYPTLSFLDVEPPGAVYSHPAAIERVRITASRLEEYGGLLGAAERDEDGGGVADSLGSVGASVYRGMTAFAQHQGFVNEMWMQSCLKMLQEYAVSE